MVLIGEERQGEEHGGFGKTSTAVKTVVRLQTCYRALRSPKLSAPDAHSPVLQASLLLTQALGPFTLISVSPFLPPCNPSMNSLPFPSMEQRHLVPGLPFRAMGSLGSEGSLMPYWFKARTLKTYDFPFSKSRRANLGDLMGVSELMASQVPLPMMDWRARGIGAGSVAAGA